jgi:hypothetical protein
VLSKSASGARQLGEEKRGAESSTVFGIMFA